MNFRFNVQDLRENIQHSPLKKSKYCLQEEGKLMTTDQQQREEAVIWKLRHEGSSIYASQEQIEAALQHTSAPKACIKMANKIRTYVPQTIVVINIHGSGYVVLIDAKWNEEPVWLSHSGCVSSDQKVSEIIERIKNEKNQKIQVIHHYFNGTNNYLPEVENRRIV